MKIPSYLQRNRYGIFHFRRAVPRWLRQHIGKREIVHSLHTREPREAKQRGRVVAFQIENWFGEIGQRMAKKQTITTELIIDFNKGTLEATSDELAALSPDQIQAVIEASHKSLAPNRALAQNHAGASTAPSRISLADLIERFDSHRKDERGGNWTPPSTDKTKLDRLKQIIGADTLIDTIDHESAKYVRAELLKLPANTRPFRGQSAPQIIQATKGRDLPHLSDKTLNDHLELYSRLFAYACKPRWMPFDPFDGVRVKQTKKQRANAGRDMFTRDELRKIFSASPYTAPDTSVPHRYWAPLIALHTGARRAEIAALDVADVRQEQKTGVWVFDFNENAPEKRIKTINGVRLTPIHPKLIELGLLDYADQLRNEEVKRLFRELNKWDKDEGFGAAIGRWFQGDEKTPGLVRRLGIYQGKNKKVFHSFRHTVTTELYRAGVNDMQIEQICGRSDGRKSVGKAIYTKDDELPALHQALSRMDFSNELQGIRPYKSRKDY